MSDQQTHARDELQPLVFHPAEPPRLLRRVVDRFFELFLVVLLAVLLASGGSRPLLILAAIALGLSWTMRAVAWRARRRDPSLHHYDPRREIVLSASLVGRVRSLQDQDRRGEAARLLQGETDLSVSDTARALRLVREASHPR